MSRAGVAVSGFIQELRKATGARPLQPEFFHTRHQRSTGTQCLGQIDRGPGGEYHTRL